MLLDFKWTISSLATNIYDTVSASSASSIYLSITQACYYQLLYHISSVLYISYVLDYTLQNYVDNFSPLEDKQ